MKKYRARFKEIVEVDVIRETAKQVVLKHTTMSGNEIENREAKIGSWTGYFDSWDEAYEYLFEPVRKHLEYAQKEYDAIMALKK